MIYNDTQPGQPSKVARDRDLRAPVADLFPSTLADHERDDERLDLDPPIRDL